MPIYKLCFGYLFMTDKRIADDKLTPIFAENCYEMACACPTVKPDADNCRWRKTRIARLIG